MKSWIVKGQFSYYFMRMSTLTFETLVTEYGKQVFNIAYRIIGDWHEAEDITQETFERIYLNLNTFRNESTIGTWIHKIAVTTTLKRKSKINKEYVDSIDDKIAIFEDTLPSEVKSWYADPEKSYLIHELTALIRDECYYFISFRLSIDQRIVYILKYVFDFSIKTISVCLDLSPNTVKVRLHRARKNLIQYFETHCTWFNKNNVCSCESRMGFALAVKPELLQHVRKTAPHPSMNHVIHVSLSSVPNIEEIFKNLPLVEYEIPEALYKK